MIAVAATAAAGAAAGEPASRTDWTGIYVGTHVGSAWVVNHWRSADGPFAPGGALDSVFPSRFSSGGMMAGAQLGYNRQVGAFVFGIEADAEAADIDQPARCANSLFTCAAKIDALGTITGRLGWAFENVLLYGKAGGAWAHEKFELVPSQPKGSTTTNVFHGDQLRWGYAAGIGAEYAISSSLSAKFEYTYLGLGSSSAAITDQFGERSNVVAAQQAHLIKLGLNYRLGDARFGDATPPWAPLVPAAGSSLGAGSWTGFYIGVHAGGGWGMTDWNGATGALATVANFYFPGSGTANGLVAGGQIGFNYQVGPWVIGAEAEGAWSNLDGFAKCAASLATAGNPGDALTCHTRIDALGMVSGRVGQTWGDLMVYGKAGAAFAKERHDASQSERPSYSGSDTRTGYVIGSGIEYAFTPAWSGKVEYNYIDLGNKRVGMAGAGDSSSAEIGQKLNIFKIGLNYRIAVDPFAAAPAVARAGITKAPRLIASADWTAEAGARYWASSGSMYQDLYNAADPSRLVSRLTYGDMNGHAAETFMRFDHRSGLFAKGYFGIGSLVDGQLNDEDFYLPGHQAIYSNTISAMKDGTLRYGSLDVGYNVLSAPAGRLGVFVGYHYLHQIGRGFGCRQIATDTMCVPTVPTGNLGLTETETWRGAAIGLNARMELADRWRLDVDAAYLPYVDRSSTDNHWLRAEENPGPEDGRGWGTQVEAVLTYAVTDRFSVGVGGRYWYFATTAAAAQFTGNAQTSPLKFASDRYGGFLQASYRFGDDGRPAVAPAQAPASWSGIYVGAHLGAGWGRSDWSDPFPPPVYGDRVTTGGALAGGQIGVNYQSGRFVLGAEARGSWAQIEGTMTCFAGLVPQSDAGANCGSSIDGLATLTGRLGVAAGPSLFYASGGAALARERFVLNTVAYGGQESSARATKAGWTVGGGLEQALTAHWSVGIDYKYVDFGSTAVNFAVPAVYASAASETVSRHVHLVTMGVNYRFDPAELSAR